MRRIGDSDDVDGIYEVAVSAGDCAGYSRRRFCGTVPGTPRVPDLWRDDGGSPGECHACFREDGMIYSVICAWIIIATL